jgi:hypothetical protein
MTLTSIANTRSRSIFKEVESPYAPGVRRLSLSCLPRPPITRCGLHRHSQPKHALRQGYTPSSNEVSCMELSH